MIYTQLLLFASVLVRCFTADISFDFAFYYNSIEHEIIFYNYQSSPTAELTLDPNMNSLYPIYLNEFQKTIKEEEVLLPMNLIDNYTVKAQIGEFSVANHSLLLDSIPIYLIKISYDVASTKYEEVIMEVPSMTKVATYPYLYQDKIGFNQCVECSKKAIKRTKKEISNTYGFQLRNDLLIEGLIEKMYLVGRTNDRLIYYADLSASYMTQKREGSLSSFDFYMEKLPTNFDLHFTYHVDNEPNFHGQKLMVTIKDINYPYFKFNENPNSVMFISIVSLILISSVLTGIGNLTHRMLQRKSAMNQY